MNDALDRPDPDRRRPGAAAARAGRADGRLVSDAHASAKGNGDAVSDQDAHEGRHGHSAARHGHPAPSDAHGAIDPDAYPGGRMDSDAAAERDLAPDGFPYLDLGDGHTYDGGQTHFVTGPDSGSHAYISSAAISHADAILFWASPAPQPDADASADSGPADAGTGSDGDAAG